VNAQQNTRIYRGKSLEEILPRIKEELGPDAIVVRRRDGLVGGIGGFFQRPFVEVEARVGGPSIDVYDEHEGDAMPDYAELEPTPEAAQFEALDFDGADFAAELASAAEPELPEPPALDAPPESDALWPDSEPVEEPPAAPARVIAASSTSRAESRRRQRAEEAQLLGRELVSAGIDEDLAAAVVGEALSHAAPFAPGSGLRTLVRRTLARRIPVEPYAAHGGRVVAFAGAGGSGKTLCAEQMAAAYAAAGDLDVVFIAFRTDTERVAASLPPLGVPVVQAGSSNDARAAIAEHREHALVVIDTPAAPRDTAAVGTLAGQVKRIGGVEVHMCLPATLSRRAADELLGRLGPFKPSRIALTHADETGHVGPAVDLALAARIPFSYVARADEGPELRPAEPAKLASGVLP
jgi:flagellar biosynthesis protein FlhF